MKTALFVNISGENFTGYWNGKPKTFKPGEKVYMEDWLANHFAKHLTNKILLSKGEETATSPKKPEQVPKFMEIFNQCCIVEDEEEKTDEDAQIEILQKSHETKKKTIKKPESSSEEEFEGLK